MATSPATIGGVAAPQSTGTPNPDVPVASPPAASTIDTSGGTSSGSLLNSQASSRSEQLSATGGGSTQKVFQIYPTTGTVAPPIKEATDIVLADWYRAGRPATNTDPGLVAKSVAPFEYDERPASIRVFGLRKTQKGGTTKKDVELIPAYTKFLLESVQEAHVERSQIVETFGDWYIFFFGERPSTYQFSGTLINTRNANWVSDFKFYYDQYLRGTKCVENTARLILTYGGRQIEGFMTNMQTSTDAVMEAGAKVSFSVVVTRKTFLSFSDDFGSVTINGKNVQDSTFQALLNKIAGIAGTGLSDPATSAAHKQTSDVMANNAPAAGILS